MATYEITTEDGKTYEVETADAQPSSAPSLLDKAASAVTDAQEKISPALNIAKKAATGAMLMGSPADALGNMSAQGVNEALAGLGNEAGGTVSDLVGRLIAKTAPDYTGNAAHMASGAAGLAVSQIPQLLAIGKMLPEGSGINARVGVPEIPADKAAQVAAAERYGVPLTRSEMTGSKPASLIESGLEKTLTGSGPIQKFRNLQKQAIEAASERVKANFGTNETPTISGMSAKGAQAAEELANKAIKNDLYSKIPKDLKVPTSALNSEASNILNEVKNLDAADMPSPEMLQRLTSYEGMGINPAKTAETFGKTGTQVENIPASQGVNFEALRAARSNLGKIAEKGGVEGMYATRLKQAIDRDIDTFSKAGTGIEKMAGQEAASTFRRANSYYKDLKTLQDNSVYQKLKNAKFEDMPDIVFKKGNKTDVLVAKASLGQEGFNALKKQFFNDLIESKNIEGALSKYDDDFLRTVFTGSELSALKDIANIKKASLGAEKIAGNPSGTAQNIVGAATLGELARLGFKAFTNPISSAAEAVGILGVPYVGSKAYLASTRGLPMLSASGSPVVSKLAAMLQAQKARKSNGSK